MLGFRKRWFGRSARGSPRETEDADFDYKREVQSLHLELQERERLIAALKGDLERLRRGEGGRIEEAVRGHREQFLAEAAAPAAQLLTQAHLLEVEGKPVQARDVLALARRLIRLLGDGGLPAEAGAGGRAPSPPTRPEPLGDWAPAPGQPVVVRFVGMTCRGKVLRKASVGPA